MKTVKSIIILGGGTAGYVTALILKQKFGANVNIKVIHSSKIGIIGVGEGSTEHWADFLKFVGIDHSDVIKQCDATIKCGILFKGWSDQDYLHNVATPYDQSMGQTRIGYMKLIAEGAKPFDIVQQEMLANKVPKHHAVNRTSPVNQYHFNTFKLNEFLTNTAKERDIEVIDDDIVDSVLNDQGEIEYIFSENKKYHADFFIDSTGFKKLLISKLGAKWQSYKEFLKPKAAMVFPTGDTENYNCYTTATAMEYGWRFNIPVFGRHGNGYIYDSDYVTADQAHQELERDFGKTIDIAKHITFDPGALDRPWIKNCLAVGLAANFIEPLEASSIGSSIQQAYLLMHNLPNYNDKTIEFVNKQINSITDNIRDFVCLHYITNRTDTNFWMDLKSISLPDSLSAKLELWKTRLPIEEDFTNNSKYIMFYERNFIMVMHGLKLINQESIRKEYESLNTDHKEQISKILEAEKQRHANEVFLTHKQYLEIIRATK
jgi:tryptophan halogenase